MATDKSEINYYSNILYVLGVALIEIRATDDLEYARIMADIFHNVPAKISTGSSIEEVEAEINSKAKRHGYSDNVSSIIEHAKRRNKSL